MTGRISREDLAALADALRERGMTIDRLSEATGLHPSSIKMIMTGELIPLPDIRRRLAEALGLDTRDIT